MKYIGFVQPPVAGTKFATVKIVSAAKGVPIPDGKVLVEVSRAQDFFDCYITFDKIMPKGSGSASVICSKIQKVDPPQVEEKNSEPEGKKAESEPDVEKLKQQNVSLRKNLEKAEAAIDALEKQIASLRKELASLQEADKLVLGGEEYFPGEKKDMVLAAVAEAVKGLEDKTRRSDVLKDILESNEYEHLLDKKREAVEKILKGYSELSGTMKKRLADLGLLISDVGAHYKIRYYGNPRYYVTMAKTPSDSRHGDSNLIAKIKKKML